MSFTYPLGLLGLLAIPFLILIYILKNKHTEQVIASTYLWTLSERFLKRRNPLSRLTGVISLFLQILVVACISFAIAHPVFTLKGAADDYVFILDCSGSMHYEEDGVSRFERGREWIDDKIEKSAKGSTYTLVTVGESTGVLFEGVEDATFARTLLEGAALSATAPSFGEARNLAQGYFNANPSSKIYLLSDKTYESLENVELVSLSSKQENYAIAELSQKVEGENGGNLIVSGLAYSYESDASLRLALDVVNGGESKRTEITCEVAKSAVAEDGSLIGTPFSFTLPNEGFQSLKVTILNEDGLALDNESVLYNVNAVSHAEAGKILIVDGVEDVAGVPEDKQHTPFFLESALKTLVGTDAIEVVDKTEYDASMKGYSLYVFEHFTPAVLPADGAVWFVDPQADVAGSGFSVQSREEGLQPTKLEYNPSTSTRVRELLLGTVGNDIYVNEYVKCSFYRQFHTLLTLGGSPVVAAGTNSFNNREVVFAFDFHASDFTLQYDYMVLMQNLFRFTFPTMLDKTAEYCGNALSINVLANCTSIRVDTPRGDVVYLDAGGDRVEYVLTEVGTYKITQTVEDTLQTSVYVYGNLPMAERVSVSGESGFAVSGTPSSERRDGIYDDLILLFILLALLFILDWGVYSYEQYQLR